MNVVAAVDCGATSIRVCRVDLDAPVLTADVVHRVAHAPIRDDAGHLRWDWSAIVDGVLEGLQRCVAAGPLAAVGVDTWAVDYGLLDDAGNLLSAPYAYRDHRTDDYRTIVEEFGAEQLYTINGLQLQPFNTVFQLARHDRGELSRAARLAWLPELLVNALAGVAHTERTSAGSSGLVDVRTGDWSDQLLELAGVDRELVGRIEAAGRVVGEWQGVPVTLVAGHDTASAVAGMGAISSGGSAFVATGTWMLCGVERPTPDTSDWARARNFTNEAGALDGFRFLRNVTGFWLLEQCRARWGNPAVVDLLAAAEAVDTAVPIVDVDDDSLKSPSDMVDAYCALARLAVETAPAVVTRSIVESIAARTAEVIDQLGDVASFDDIVLFGGAARVNLLVDRVANICAKPVRVGAAEASALGNAIVQGIALGVFDGLADGRKRISEQNDMKR